MNSRFFLLLPVVVLLAGCVSAPKTDIYTYRNDIGGPGIDLIVDNELDSGDKPTGQTIRPSTSVGTTGASVLTSTSASTQYRPASASKRSVVIGPCEAISRAGTSTSAAIRQ